MTTGSRGLHIVVPLTERQDFDEVREFARDVADTLAAAHPDRPGAPVATPIAWADLDDPDLHARRWTIADAVEKAHSDPWAGLMGRARALGPARRRLDSLKG